MEFGCVQLLRLFWHCTLSEGRYRPLGTPSQIRTGTAKILRLSPLPLGYRSIITVPLQVVKSEESRGFELLKRNLTVSLIFKTRYRTVGRLSKTQVVRFRLLRE